MIRLRLPEQLRTLAGVGREIEVEVDGEVTLRSVLDALEQEYPMLRGTLRNPATGQRRPFIRFFVAEQDYSNIAPDDLLPGSLATGAEVLMVVGAIAGG
ncbi:MAG: MoaD/ThiS family protein [Actinomycetota bacterium]|nr:MoaD/ThiS family protein [Actinomycetota bacterium]